MPKIQRIIVPDIPPPVGHYCHVTRAGPHVWVAGVVGQAQDGSIPSDVVAQFDVRSALRLNQRSVGWAKLCRRRVSDGAQRAHRIASWRARRAAVVVTFRFGAGAFARPTILREWNML
jgi:hypothetical protein